MRFALMLEPQQGLSYGDQSRSPGAPRRTASRRSSAPTTTQSFPGPAGQPTTDAWTVLAGLARDTDRIGLGVLVSPVTFRHPGTSPRSSTTVDEMSGGRIEVGVGAGWNELEHRQLGLAVPADQGAGRPAWRTRWRSSTACGASRTAGRIDGSPGRDPGRAVPSEAGRRRRPAADADRRRRPRLHRRRPGLAAVVPASPRAMRTSST